MPSRRSNFLTLIIQSIELREIRLPLVHFFETSFGRTTERRIVLARVTDSDGAEGWGECTAGEGPFYSNEWTDTAWATLHEFLAPMVAGKKFRQRRADVFRGDEAGARSSHGESDNRKRVLGSRGEEARRAFVATSWRHAPARSLAAFRSAFKTRPRSCSRRFARKSTRVTSASRSRSNRVGTSAVVARVRKEFPEIRLMGDANSAYTLADVVSFQRARSLQPDDARTAARARRHLRSRKAATRRFRRRFVLTSRSVQRKTRLNAIALGSCKIINVKLGRVGGHSEAKRLEQVAREQGIPVWCGGMLESGIGRAHNIAMSTLAGFTFARRRFGQRALLGRRHHRTCR